MVVGEKGHANATQHRTRISQDQGIG
jgi:hypothetical protein